MSHSQYISVHKGKTSSTPITFRTEMQLEFLFLQKGVCRYITITILGVNARFQLSTSRYERCTIKEAGSHTLRHWQSPTCRRGTFAADFKSKCCEL